MKGFERENRLFSLCGLNCGLCPMHLDGYCPGCGGGAGNQSCAAARCSMRNGNIEYCFQCRQFPCSRYERQDEYDSFITHRNRLTDIKKAERLGIEAYREEQEEKRDILSVLLAGYNDGRKKSFYCTAVNLLELKDLKEVMKQIPGEEIPVKERAVYVTALLRGIAEQRGIELKLRKKPKT